MQLAGGKHVHHCCFHFLECLHELHIGCEKVVDHHILLNPCVGKVGKQHGELVCLVVFLSCIGAKCCLPQRHVVDVAHFGKGGHPVDFPVGPGVVGNDATVPLALCHGHVAAHKCVLCPGGDHGGLRDGYSRDEGKHLAAFLLPCVDSQG
jgi:hypothetical protein